MKASREPLSKFDPSYIRERLLADHVNIWEVILASSEFDDWAYGNYTSKLYIHGAPQSGKTTFSAVVAEKLLSEYDDQGTVGVASVFLDPDDYFVNDHLIFGEATVSMRHAFIQAIIQQLLGGDITKQSRQETLDDLRSEIKAQCTSSRKIYIIVDGLDRCPESSRRELEDEIATLVDYGCYVMITNYLGLPMDNVVEYTCDDCNTDRLNHYWNCRACGVKVCDLCTEERQCSQLNHDTRRLREAAIELAPSEEEMRLFIRHELCLRLEQRDFDDELHEHLQTQLERVEKAICDHSGGVLVICKALLGYLRDFQWAGYEEIMQVQTRVKRPEEETFNILLSKIKLQDPALVETAFTALSLVSQIPPGSTMVFDELRDALRSFLKVENAISKQDLYALCQGMIVIDGDGIVRPFHGDFSIHLQENCTEDFRMLGVNLADVTMKTLRSLPSYSTFAPEIDQALNKKLLEQPFLGYAAPNWGRHLRHSTSYTKLDERKKPPVGSLVEQAIDLMRNPCKLAVCLYVANLHDQGFDLWPGSHALHICAGYGLTKLVKYFTSDSHSAIDATDSVYGRTPLMIAASRGHTEFAQRMIELGADVTFESQDGRSALLEAVERDAEQQGYYDITKLIIGHMPTSKEQRHAPVTTPLIACMRKCKKKLLSTQLISLLLEHPSTDVNESTFEGHTALMEAVDIGAGDTEVLDLLLKHQGLRLDVQNREGKTALHLAVQYPQQSTAIKSLLHSPHCTPAMLNIRDSSGMTAAMALLRNEDMDREDAILVLRTMSERGADFSCTDSNGRGLLHAAAAGEHAPAVDFLHLEKELPLDAIDSFGWCALHYASRTRAPETTSRLLELGASSTLCDTRGWSPFDIVCCDDPEDENVQRICELLKASDLPQSPAMKPTTPLRPAWTFATCELDEFQQQCESPPKDFWLPDPKCGNLALHCAVEENNIPLCDLLLQETDINTPNAEGRSCLFLAIDRLVGHEDPDSYTDMINFLLSRGASLQAGLSGLDALETARQRSLVPLALLLIEHGGLPLRYGPDFRALFEEAALTANVSVIEKLRDAQLHPLKRHDSRRLSEIVNAGYISEEIVKLVTSMEHAALERIWPVEEVQ